MRILQVVPTLSPNYGGPSVSLIGLCKALARENLGVAIATTRTNGKTAVESVIVHEFPRQFSFLLPRDFSYSQMLKEWLKKHLKQFDLVHVHTLFTYTSAQACRSARELNIPYILRPCGMLDPQCLEQSKLKKAIWMKLFERSNLDNAAAIHFTSDDERKAAGFLRLKAPNVVIPLGVDQSRLKEKANESPLDSRLKQFAGQKKILFLSRLHPKKGLDLLIPAIRAVAKKRDDFVFVLAGSGESQHEAEVLRLLCKTGIDQRTIVAGFMAVNEKWFVFSQSDLFVLPSYQENFGMAVAEAMAAGLPVVISDRVNIHHDVQAYKAGIVTKCDVQEIANAIETLLDNEAMRKEMGENGRRLVRDKFNWDVITPQIIKLYEQVLSGRKVESSP